MQNVVISFPILTDLAYSTEISVSFTIILCYQIDSFVVKGVLA